MTRTNRDDRTIRVIRHLTGGQNHDVTFTHFMGASVHLSATSETLAGENGFLAFAVAANMLVRFIGNLALVVFGRLEGELVARLDWLLADLKSIDSRPAKVVTLHSGLPASEPEAWLHIGETPQDVAHWDGRAVLVGFDSWTCTLRRGRLGSPAVDSTVPFGALASACFGVAEIFKTVLTAAVPNDGTRSALQGRSVKAFQYSVWHAERSDFAAGAAKAPDDLGSIPLSGLLQVGAGAVGNATILALGSTRALVGAVRIVDLKVVDEKNLNRCLFFREEDLARPKVEVLVTRGSRPDFQIDGRTELCSSDALRGMWLILSTVDNNDVRHAVQEQLPQYIVQGSTSATSVAVSVHTAADRLSCLVCRHPDRELGTARRIPLPIQDMAARIGVAEEVIQRSEFLGSREITCDFIAAVSQSDAEAAEYFAQEARAGHDLCGAIGDLRARYGTTTVPEEASIPFASVFAGVQAAAEVVKLVLRRNGAKDIPVLRNVLQIDFGFDYSRHESLAFPEPRRDDCQLCAQREIQVKELYRSKWGCK
jgi:molybdopterin/thiamine biosynthesis adenylyltransferase